MTFYFIGAEDHDFERIGTVSVDTATTAARRTANSRCSLRVGGLSAATDAWQASGGFGTTLTSFWLAVRGYFGSGIGSNTYDTIVFSSGTTRRLMVHLDGSSHVRISKQNAAGTRTTLATSSNLVADDNLYRFDIQVSSYGASGTVNVYLDDVLWVTYTGDLTTDSSTSLSGFGLGNTSGGSGTFTYWSEVFVSSDDTRGLSLMKLPPAADGATFAWTGSTADIDETTSNDSDICTSGTASQVALSTIDSSGITGAPAIYAVCVSGRGQKGGSGPANLNLAVRTGGTNYFSGDKALNAAFGRGANIFETNPATAAAWVYTDLTAGGFNIGMRSAT